MKNIPADQWSRRLGWDELDVSVVQRLIAHARDEDLYAEGLAQPPAYRGDVSAALLPANEHGEARLTARGPLVVAGLPLVPLIIQAYRADVAWQPAVADGAAVGPGEALGTLSGRSGDIIELERVLLNFVQKLTGVATETALYVRALGDSPTRLLDTRKTTPGYRYLEKYAVARGGGWNHRMGLYDRVMLKDNHLAASNATAGASLTALVALARRRYPDLVVQVEVDRLDQIEPVLAAGAQWILLDNFTPQALREAVGLIGDQAATEASGGITLETLPALGALGLDFISTGATVHQSRWQDVGLDWR